MIKSKFTKSLSLVLAFVMALSVLVGVMPYNRSGATARFKDVSSQDWFYDAVEYVAENDLMSGTSSTRFSPKKTMTRAQFVMVLYRLTGDNVQDAASAGFSDVKSTDYYYNAVNWASKNGITSGVGNNKFDPNGSVSREQMATFLARYIEKFHQGKFTASSNPSAYTDDAKISNWAKSAIYDLTAYGLINGANGNKVQPKNVLSRAEGAAVLMRVHQTVAKNDEQQTTPVTTTTLDKNESSKLAENLAKALYYEGATTFPNVTPNLNNAAEQYLLNGTDPKVTMSGKAQGEINSFSVNSYTDAERFVNNLKSSNSFILKVSGGRVGYDSYGVAVANTPSGVKVCIVTEGGTSQQPVTPVNPTPVTPTPTPVNPNPVTPTPTPATTSNTDIENQLYEYLRLALPSYGVTSVPTRNTQLDTAAKLIAEGKYTNVDDALKAAGFSKPYMDTTSPSDPYTTLSYAHWSEKFENLNYTDIATLASDLVKRGSKCMTASYSGSVAKLGYDEIGISAVESNIGITVGMIMYENNPEARTMTTDEKLSAFIQDQLSKNLDVSAEQLEMLDSINKERSAVGVPELKMLPELNAIAYARAKECIEAYDKYGTPHKRPNGDSFSSILSDFNLDIFRGLGVSENATFRQSGERMNATQAMINFMNSPSHREAILDKSHTYVGIACYYNIANDSTTWVQFFTEW